MTARADFVTVVGVPNQDVKRRSVASGLWATPLLAVAAAAPAVAVTPCGSVSIATTGLGDGTYDLALRDSMNVNSGGGGPYSVPVATVVFQVSAPGQSLSGLAITVRGDDVKDGELPPNGSFMIAFYSSTTTTGMGESPTKKTVTGTTTATGTFTVKVATATYGQIDCGAMPRSGFFWVDVTLPCGVVTTRFSYQVKDGPLLVPCL